MLILIHTPLVLHINSLFILSAKFLLFAMLAAKSVTRVCLRVCLCVRFIYSDTCIYNFGFDQICREKGQVDLLAHHLISLQSVDLWNISIK